MSSSRLPSEKVGLAVAASAKAMPRSGPWRVVLVGVALSLGLGLGILVALLVANEAWPLLVAAVLAVPALVLMLRHPLVAIMAWMLLLPFFLGPPTPDKLTFFWILHRLMIPGTLALSIAAGWLGLSKRRSIRLDPADLAMLGLLIWAAISTVVWNPNLIVTTSQLYDRVFVPCCAYWLIKLAAPRENDLKPFLVVAFIALAIQASVALLTWFFPQVLPPQWVSMMQRERSVGLLRQPAIFSSTLVFLGLLLYHYAMNCRGRALRYLLMATFGLTIFSVLLSFQRASWLGGLTVLLGLLWIYPRATFRLLLILVVLAVILGTMVFTAEVDWGYERLQSERTAEARLIIGNALIRMIEKRPLLGWGYNNYHLYSSQYMVPLGDLPVLDRWDQASHNTYMTIAAELGLPGLFLYLFPTGWWLVHSLKVRRRLPRVGFWSWRLVAVLWLAMLHIFIESNFIDVVTYHPFGTTLWWIELGLIANMVQPFIGPQGMSDPAEQS